MNLLWPSVSDVVLHVKMAIKLAQREGSRTTNGYGECGVSGRDFKMTSVVVAVGC